MEVNLSPWALLIGDGLNHAGKISAELERQAVSR